MKDEEIIYHILLALKWQGIDIKQSKYFVDSEYLPTASYIVGIPDRREIGHNDYWIHFLDKLFAIGVRQGDKKVSKIKECPEGHDHTSNCRRNGCPCNEHRHTIAAELGRVGGQVKSEAKTKAARTNGKLGGRPKTIGVSKEDNKVHKTQQLIYSLMGGLEKYE